MTELTLELDSKASNEFAELMRHYKIKSRADLVTKGIAFLKMAAYIDKTQGELIARKGNRERKIVVG